MSGGLQSPARCPDCGAHLTLRMDCTRGETWPCTCRRGLFGAPPPESIAATVEALAAPTDLDRANARRIIAEQRLETLRDALREQVLTWQRASIEYASRAEWARDPAAASMNAHAARLKTCAHELEALLAAQAGDESGEAGR